MREFTFNTGVSRTLGYADKGIPIPLMEHQRWAPAVGGGQVKVILVYADVPEGSTLLFATDYDDLPESKVEGIVVAPITGGLLSKYGYFRLPV